MHTKPGWGLISGLALIVSGCAPRPIPIQPPPPIVFVTPPPPSMPAGGYVGMKIPAKLKDGKYFTPNLNNTDSAAVWHLRNALNVAALGCDLEGGGIVDAYNAWIKTHAAVIDRYYQALIREWQEPGWIDWQRVYDDDQTRIYNFYAQPAMRATFCAAARLEVTQVGQISDEDLPTFARAALVRLDKPFVDFYAAFDAWQTYYQSFQPKVEKTENIPVVIVPPPGQATHDGINAPEPQTSPTRELP